MTVIYPGLYPQNRGVQAARGVTRWAADRSTEGLYGGSTIRRMKRGIALVGPSGDYKRLHARLTEFSLQADHRPLYCCALMIFFIFGMLRDAIVTQLPATDRHDRMKNVLCWEQTSIR